MSINILLDDGGVISLRFPGRAIEQTVLDQLMIVNEKVAKDAVELLTSEPPLTPGNFPPAPYWERNVGMKNAAGETIELSEKYSRSKDRWQYETSLRPGEVLTVASTDIPYAPYVGNADLQAWFHAENGWLTDDQVVAAMLPEAQKEADTVLRSALAGMTLQG
jgi:hypothetical protein